MAEISETLTGYLLIWSEQQITVDVSRLRDNRDGTHCEILVRPYSPKTNETIFFMRANHNLSSLTSRREKIKELTENYPTYDWKFIFEELSYNVLNQLRRREPATETVVSALDNIAPPEYLLWPFVIKNNPNVIFGDPSAGKSLLAVILTQCMMLPWKDNPLHLKVPNKSIRCLVLDYENSQDIWCWQTLQLERGHNLPSLSTIYRHCTTVLCDDIENVMTEIEAVQADVVIIDSLGPAAGGDLNLTLSPLNFFNALRRLKVTSLVIAHNAKGQPGDNKKRTIYGNQFFTTNARNVWECRKEQSPGDNILTIGLFHSKAPPHGKLQMPIGIRVTFDSANEDIAQSYTVCRCDLSKIPGLAEHLPLNSQISELLRDGEPRSPKDIAEYLNANDGSVRNELRRMKGKQKVSTDDSGNYYLLSEYNGTQF